MICRRRPMPKRLVMPEKPVSYYYIEQYREQKSLFAGVAAFRPASLSTSLSKAILMRNRSASSGNLCRRIIFRCSACNPSAGRVLSAELDKPGDAPVVVISDRFWRNRLNSSPMRWGKHFG